MPEGLDVVAELKLPGQVVPRDVYQEALGGGFKLCLSPFDRAAAAAGGGGCGRGGGGGGGGGGVAKPQLLEGQEDVTRRVALQRRAAT